MPTRVQYNPETVRFSLVVCFFIDSFKVGSGFWVFFSLHIALTIAHSQHPEGLPVSASADPNPGRSSETSSHRAVRPFRCFANPEGRSRIDTRRRSRLQGHHHRDVAPHLLSRLLHLTVLVRPAGLDPRGLSCIGSCALASPARLTSLPDCCCSPRADDLAVLPRGSCAARA